MKLRSAEVIKGPERAPNRSLFYAMGYTDEELSRPLIGVVSAFNEIIPGHIHLDKNCRGGKDRGEHGGGNPHPVPGHRRLRRHCHGS